MKPTSYQLLHPAILSINRGVALITLHLHRALFVLSSTSIVDDHAPAIGMAGVLASDVNTDRSIDIPVRIDSHTVRVVLGNSGCEMVD